MWLVNKRYITKFYRKNKKGEKQEKLQHFKTLSVTSDKKESLFSFWCYFIMGTQRCKRHLLFFMYRGVLVLNMQYNLSPIC